MNSTFKYCVVPECKSTSKMTPNKMFITVPRNEQTRRKWLTLAYKQNANSISLDTKMYFCEDHFDLPNDMINYMEYSTGQVSKIRMKSGCTPTKFECQKGRINILEKRRMLSRYCNNNAINNNVRNSSNINMLFIGQAILANTPKVQEYPIKQSDKMSKNNDHCSNNIQTNKQEESQIANDKTLNSSTDHCKTTQDKHIYNIKTILECTNSSLIRIRGMLGCTCYFCDLDFENPLELKKHAINTHTVINEYCFSNTPLSRLLFLLDITDLRCIICSDNIQSLESIITHLNDVHNKKLFLDIKNQILPFKFYCNLLVCSKCSMKFVDHRKLVPHLHTHCKNYTCDKCDSGFAYPYALKRHCTTCHDVTCGICSMEFRNKLALNEHVNNCYEPWQYARAMDYSSSKNNCADKLPLAYKSNISSENPSFGPTNVSVEPICMRVDPPNITKPMDPPVSYDPMAVITNVESGESLDIKMEERDAGPSTTEAGSVLCTVRQTVKATELTAQGSDRTPSQYCSETSNESIKNNVKIEDKQILVLKCDTCGGGFWDKKWRDIHVKWVHNDNTDVEKMLRCNTESYYNHSLRLRCTDLSEPSKHFFNISLLLRHTNATLIFSQEVFGCICYFCVRHYKTPSILKQHSSDEHSPIPRKQVYKSYYLRNIDKVDITGLRCKLCNYNFKTLETIKTHLEKFHDLHFYFETETRTVPVLFNNLTPLCCYCGIEFDNCQILAYHVMRNHYRKNICETCGLGFVTKKQIIRHTQVYNRVHGIFLCEVCLEPFDDYKTLKEHEDILHDKILKDSFSNEVHRSCNSRKDRKSKRQNAGFRNNPKRPTNVLGSLGHQSVPLNEFANTGIKNEIDTALSTKIIYCTNSAPFNSGKAITARSEKIAVNGPQTTSVISKNISIAPQNMRAEIRQKCDACNMVFKTWDALSGHVKECTSFANCLSDEDEIVSQNKRAKHGNS